MNDKKIEEMLSVAGKKVRPSTAFALKMRLRVARKGWVLFWADRAFSFQYAGAVAMIIVVFGGGGVGVGSYAYASDEVTEGTPLYPIKIGLEKIEEILPRSPEDKPKFYTKMAGRRMAEAEHIARRMHNIENLEAYEKEVLEKTLQHMEGPIDNAMHHAETEFDPERAERVLQHMYEDFQDIDGKLGQLVEEPHIVRHNEMRNRFDDMRSGMKTRFERMDGASEEVEDAIRTHRDRIRMSFDYDDDSRDGDHMDYMRR
ncbi:DUF5667 domain-containing protein [Pseudomonadota bacterium]